MNFLKKYIIEGIMSSLESLFSSFNRRVSTIVDDVSVTPDEFNNDIFSLVQSITENVILPIAGIILAYVLVYELVQMVISQNNLQFETVHLYRWILKAYIAAYILSHTLVIATAIFDVGQYAVEQSGIIIGSNMEVDLDELLQNQEEILEGMGVMSLLGFWI